MPQDDGSWDHPRHRVLGTITDSRYAGQIVNLAGFVGF